MSWCVAHMIRHSHDHQCSLFLHAYTVYTNIYIHMIVNVWYIQMMHAYINMYDPLKSTWFHLQTICYFDVIEAVCGMIMSLFGRKRSGGWRRQCHHVLWRRLQPSQYLLQTCCYSLPSINLPFIAQSMYVCMYVCTCVYMYVACMCVLCIQIVYVCIFACIQTSVWAYS